MPKKEQKIAEHRTLKGTKYVINREKSSLPGKVIIKLSKNRVHIILKNDGMRRELIFTTSDYNWDKERPNGSNVVYQEKSESQSSQISLCNNKVVTTQILTLEAKTTRTDKHGTSMSRLTNYLNGETSAEKMMSALLNSARVSMFINSVMQEFKEKQPSIEYKFRGYEGYDEFKRLLSSIIDPEAQDYINNILRIYSVPNSSCDLPKEKKLAR